MGFMDTLKRWFGTTTDRGTPPIAESRDFASDASPTVKQTSQELDGSAEEEVRDMTDQVRPSRDRDTPSDA
jgi:hypothetical protein